MKYKNSRVQRKRKMKCVHCGINRNYYSNAQHASRRSCNASENGYHKFDACFRYYFVSCWESIKNTDWNIFGGKKKTYHYHEMEEKNDKPIFESL